MEEYSERERGLFERSEFRSSRIFLHGVGNPEGRGRVKMVFGPFAETKGPRRAGAKPRRENHSLQKKRIGLIPSCEGHRILLGWLAGNSQWLKDLLKAVIHEPYRFAHSQCDRNCLCARV